MAFRECRPRLPRPREDGPAVPATLGGRFLAGQLGEGTPRARLEAEGGVRGAGGDDGRQRSRPRPARGASRGFSWRGARLKTLRKIALASLAARVVNAGRRGVGLPTRSRGAALRHRLGSRSARGHRLLHLPAGGLRAHDHPCLPTADSPRRSRSGRGGQRGRAHLAAGEGRRCGGAAGGLRAHRRRFREAEGKRGSQSGPGSSHRASAGLPGPLGVSGASHRWPSARSMPAGHSRRGPICTAGMAAG